MGKAKKTRKFAAVKRMINPKDMRIKKNQKKAEEKRKKALAAAAPRHVEQAVSALFFQYNAQLGPPYHIIVDTNFINFAIKNKIDRKPLGLVHFYDFGEEFEFPRIAKCIENR